MSYTNETTHYGIPKPLGTDLTVPMDYNEAADAIDQALFDATTNATEAVTAANNAVEAAAEAVEDVGDLGTEVNNLKGRTSALEATEIIQNNKIDALELEGVTKFDSVGIADAYVNGLTYSVGDVVTYNGQRYKCTTAVVAAEPFDADKWSAEDVETVLNDIKSDLPKLVHSFIPDSSDTYTSMLTKIADHIKALNLEDVDLNRLALLFSPATSTKRLFRITKYNNTIGYYSFEAVNNGVELQACVCHITGASDASKFTHLVFNTGNTTWTYSEDTSASAGGRNYELYFV